jgi:hypothetical protein
MTEAPLSKLDGLVLKAADYYKNNPTYTVGFRSGPREFKVDYLIAARFTLRDEKLLKDQTVLNELLSQAENQYPDQYEPKKPGVSKEATSERLARIMASLMPVLYAGMLGLTEELRNNT